jgi:hypothetical protein
LSSREPSLRLWETLKALTLSPPLGLCKPAKAAPF